MRRLFNYSLIFGLGGSVYCLIETLWRGRTHWSMGFAGGAAMLSFLHIGAGRGALWRRALRCCAAVTALELAIGWLVNLRLRLGVWDYSSRRFNFLGQICPLYSGFWLLFSLPGMWICGLLRRNMKW